MIKNIFCLISVFLIGLNATAQRRTGDEIIRGGLVSVGFNASPGFLMNSATAAYIGGELEIYLHKRVSVRGDISFYIPTPNSYKTLAHNHSLFWGFNYHMPYKKLDFLIGLQPGLSIVQSYKEDGNFTTVQAIPVISALGGCQIYCTRFFHCYVLARFVAGTYFRDAATPLNMTEFRVMAGLGFHINVVPLKKRAAEVN